MNESQFQPFLNSAIKWVVNQPKISCVALVGSYARGTAHSGSDIDLIILSAQYELFIHDRSWLKNFGKVASCEVEDWGMVRSLRVFLQDNVEIEFGFSSLNWASLPIDDGTKRVISDGIKIIYDRDGVLKRAVEAVMGSTSD